MHAIPKEIYDRIDNDLYSASTNTWWQPDSVLYLLKTSVNPLRVGYAKRLLCTDLKIDPRGKRALEVGCGGGILTEEIAQMGFDTTGIDPSAHSLNIAANHAHASGLQIKYELGTGEALPYADHSFDVVFCCDVLEHVRDLPRVISEISRVLKPGGAFVFDTLNRTWVSKLIAIKLWQEWKRWALFPPGLHVWEMFIKPSEMKELLQQNNFDLRDLKGSSPSASIPKMLRYLRKRAKGEITYKELGDQFVLRESNDIRIVYMGVAVKMGAAI